MGFFAESVFLKLNVQYVLPVYRQQKDRVNPDLELIKNKRRSQKF